MAVLITGGKGFIGSHLVPALKAAGQEIVLFDNDICDREEVLSFEPGQRIDKVIHLAAQLSGREKERFQRVNVSGTANIIALAKKLGVMQIVFLSSSRALSSCSDPYIDSKKEAESLVKQSGLPYVILRPTMLYGPGDKKNIGLFIGLIKKTRLAPIFDFKLQPVFIEDLISLILGCLKEPASREITIAGPAVSFRDLIGEIKKIKPGFIELNFPKMFNFLMKSVSVLPFSSFPRWQVDTLFRNEIFSGENWPDEFKIRETPLREGLKKTL